jgi:hypothetical protein
MGTNYYIRFAQAYGQGSYNECIYNDTTACSTTGAGSTGSSPSGTLSNTGLMIALVVTIACLTIFVALVVRFWRRSRQQQLVPEEVPADQFEQQPRPDDESGNNGVPPISNPPQI